MKRTLILGLLLLAGNWARASVTLSQSFSGGTVTQGNPVGTVFNGNFTAANSGDQVLSLTVGLDFAGGYSGGFYVALTAPDGVSTVTLLNTPGTSTYGLNITLQDGRTAISSGSNLSGGTYAAYGTLGNLDGQQANGNWTLYFGDLASGGGNPTVTSWTLNVDVVPEPVNLALGVFGLLFVTIIAVRCRAGRLSGDRPV